MKRRRVTQIITGIILFASLFLNFHLYQDNQGYKWDIGEKYKRVVRKSISEIGEQSKPETWVEILQGKNGDIRLEWQLGEVSHLSTEFHRMNGEISVIGLLMDGLVEEYRDLRVVVNSGTDPTEVMDDIEERLEMLTTFLSYMEDKFGEDNLQWYKELSKPGTKTQKYIFEEYNKLMLNQK